MKYWTKSNVKIEISECLSFLRFFATLTHFNVLCIVQVGINVMIHQGGFIRFLDQNEFIIGISGIIVRLERFFWTSLKFLRIILDSGFNLIIRGSYFYFSRSYSFRRIYLACDWCLMLSMFFLCNLSNFLILLEAWFACYRHGTKWPIAPMKNS